MDGRGHARAGPSLPGEPHARLLLEALRTPERMADLDAVAWDLLVRTGRAARVLGTLHARLDALGRLDAVPVRPRQQLEGEFRISQHRAAMALNELRSLERALATYDGPLVLLKGAAYVAQGLSAAAGRLFDDVDILVPKARILDVEERLVVAGWETETPDPYDQRYYREWSHELPPMRRAASALQLDVHHTILPVTARFRVDAERLFAMVQPTHGGRFAVLHPVHQLMHAAAHVFADSDCTSRLRDLVDIDVLARRIGDDDWRTLLSEAEVAGLGRVVWHALSFARTWLGTPVPDAVERELVRLSPGALRRAAMRSLLSSALPPSHPERGDPATRRMARVLLLARHQLLRMPLWLLAYHAIRKAVRAARRRAVPGETPGPA